MNNIFEDIRSRYEERIGQTIDFHDRHVHQVEMRAALMNAMRPTCKDSHIAEMLRKDRTTIYNAASKHPVYYKTSESYRRWYAVAVDVVAELIDVVPVDMKKPTSYSAATERDIINITKTINTLKTIRKSLRDGIRKSSESRALQVRGDGSLGDDAEAVRSGEVQGVLPTE